MNPISSNSKGQGAFEYVLLLAGVVLVAVIGILVLRGSILPSTNSQIQNNTNVWGNITCLKTWEQDPTHVVGIWHFDDGQGLVAYDSSIHGNNGVLVNNPSWINGSSCVSGSCLRFNSLSTQYVNFTNLPQVNTNSFGYNTVEFWMYWTNGSDQIPFNFNSTSYNLWFHAGSFGFSTDHGDVYGMASSSSLANTWAFVTAVFYNGNYTGNNQLYINGVQQSLTQTVGTSSWNGTSSTNAVIGGYSGSTTLNFNGTIDELVLYNRALSAKEAQADYSCSG